MLTEILFLLIAAILIVPIFQRIGLGSVLGYLLAGVLIGTLPISALPSCCL